MVASTITVFVIAVIGIVWNLAEGASLLIIPMILGVEVVACCIGVLITPTVRSWVLTSMGLPEKKPEDHPPARST